MIEENRASISRVDFENILCPLCGYEKHEVLYPFSDNLGSYSVVRCTGCSFIYLNPRPTHSTISVYYEASQYTPFLSSGNEKTLFSRVYTFVRDYSVSWKRKKIERMKKGVSVMDIGCGTGEFLLEMKSHGWRSSGVEPSPEASRFARDTYQLDVKTGFIDDETLKWVSGPFDVITMWHVLEHVHEPLEALTNAKELLSGDGLMIIALPNVSSFDAGIYGKDWVALDVPRHLLHFTPATLKAMLNKAGLKIVRRHQMPLDTAFNSLMSEKKTMSRNPRYKIPFYLIRLAGCILLSWLTGLHRDKGSSVMYYVRKK